MSICWNVTKVSVRGRSPLTPLKLDSTPEPTVDAPPPCPATYPGSLGCVNDESGAADERPSPGIPPSPALIRDEIFGSVAELYDEKYGTVARSYVRWGE